jgi:hypothetical protein
MMKGLLVAAAAGAAAFPATAAADNTPAGPATLTVGYDGPIACPASSIGPGVLVAWQVDVGDGGQAGTVRPVFGDVVGDPVELPAQAGTYTFPAPHISSGIFGCGYTPGLVQTTGEHAVLRHDAPAIQFVAVAREGQPEERIAGARLAVRPVVQRDIDRDLVGDETEDRTDLRIATSAAREADGRARIVVTVANAGPLAADLPALTTKLAGARWEGDCSPIALYPACAPRRLAAGETRTFVLRGDLPDAVSSEVSVASEGPDLTPADNTAAIRLAAAPPFVLAATGNQRLSRGVKVQVSGVRAGRTRITMAFKVHGKTVKVGRVVKLAPYTQRTVTVKAKGAKLRSLRRALAHRKQTVTVTARTFSGKTPVTVKTKVRA